MDKRVIFAVAGSGKTTYIVDSLEEGKRALILTYTENNYRNLEHKIIDKFGGRFPDCITLMTFFQFLYRFCYKPYLSDKLQAKGIVFKTNPNRYAKQEDLGYFISSDGYFYSNRLSLLLDRKGIVEEIIKRIEKYFDQFIIDEVQDIAGRDFSFLELLMLSKVEILFVGDFYQHTFSTSLDGNCNKSLFDDYHMYMKRFEDKGVLPDNVTLNNSWRCSKSVCDFVSANLGIPIHSNKSMDSTIRFVSDTELVKSIIGDDEIVKLHYKNSSRFGQNHVNWGESKGEDCYEDVCVLLNKETMKRFRCNELMKLAAGTRNKLYVAITRAHRNVFLIEE